MLWRAAAREGSPIRRILANLVVLLATVTVLLGAGEAVVRQLATPMDAVERAGRLKYRFNPYQPDGLLAYSLRPGWETVHATEDFEVTVRTNQLGLRGAPASRTKPPGAERLLVLGDSFTFGFGVEDDESFAARLTGLLSEARGRPVEVLNAGVPGWSLDQHLVFLRTRGWELEPDAVLLAITENDVSDLGWHRLRFDSDNLPVRVESSLRFIDHRGRMHYREGSPLDLPQLPLPGREWLADHSALFHWLRYRVSQVSIGLSFRRAQERRAERAGPPPEAAIEALSAGEVQRGLLTGEAFQLRYHRYLVAALERECAERGTALAQLLIATRDSDPRPGSAVRALHEDCRGKRPRCLDTATLLPAESRHRFFYPHDGHWTPAAHRRVAEAVARWLTALGVAREVPAARPAGREPPAGANQVRPADSGPPAPQRCATASRASRSAAPVAGPASA